MLCQCQSNIYMNVTVRNQLLKTVDFFLIYEKFHETFFEQ